MRESTPETDPYRIDPLPYLTSINGNSSPIERLEHYYVLRPVLLRLHQDDPAAFDLAVQEITRRLKIKARTVVQDLATLAAPAAPREARELLEAMGHTRQLRLAQDFVDGLLWFGVIAGEEILLLNSARELLKPDQLSPGLTVKNHGFDRCRLSKDAILRFLGADTPADSQLLVDLQRFFSRFAAFRDPRVPLLLATWTLGTYAYRIFRVFPYLALRSPEKRCGKSRVLDLLALVAFNASSRVVQALWDVVEEERTAQPTPDVIVSPTQIAARVAVKLGWEKPSPKTLATLLNPLGFASKSTREGGSRGRRYHLHIDAVKDLLDRYREGPLPLGESS
jgi:hypothetical protein